MEKRYSSWLSLAIYETVFLEDKGLVEEKYAPTCFREEGCDGEGD